MKLSLSLSLALFSCHFFASKFTSAEPLRQSIFSTGPQMKSTDGKIFIVNTTVKMKGPAEPHKDVTHADVHDITDDLGSLNKNRRSPKVGEAEGITEDGQVISFSTVCIEDEAFCYYYSKLELPVTTQEEMKSLCPESTWMVVVFNEIVQKHLVHLVERFDNVYRTGRILLPLKSLDNYVYWLAGDNSRIPVEYENWQNRRALMNSDECAFVSERDGGRWNMEPCGGQARLVCMNISCPSIWLTTEQRGITFEKGQHISGVDSVKDCKLMCELLDKRCIGIFFSVWKQCWLFQLLSTYQTSQLTQKLHLKITQTTCVFRKHAEETEHQHDKWHLGTGFTSSRIRGKRDVDGSGNPEKADDIIDNKFRAEGEVATPAPQEPAITTTGPPAENDNGGEGGDGGGTERDSGKETKSVTQGLYTIYIVITMIFVVSLFAARIVTWFVARIKSNTQVMPMPTDERLT